MSEQHRTPSCRRAALIVASLVSLVASPLVAQSPKAKSAAKPIKLSEVLIAFLVDSGMRVRALPWSTGSQLPVAWESAAPVTSKDQWVTGRSLTTTRSASFRGTVGDKTVPMTLTLYGVEMGLARVGISLGMNDVTRDQVEQALKADGLTLQPLKCSRDKEGATYGNLLDAAKVPGKTASGLWWSWNCANDGCTLSLMILYRKADTKEVECYTG